MGSDFKNWIIEALNGRKISYRIFSVDIGMSENWMSKKAKSDNFNICQKHYIKEYIKCLDENEEVSIPNPVIEIEDPSWSLFVKFELYRHDVSHTELAKCMDISTSSLSSRIMNDTFTRFEKLFIQDYFQSLKSRHD
ncbi:MAG: hypothetical protein ACEPOW_13935 [Bacteroidales bacterium]